MIPRKASRLTAAVVSLACGCALAFALMFSAYRSGFFFDEDFYTFEFVVLALAAAIGLLGVAALAVRSGPTASRLTVRPATLLPLAIAGAYALALAAQPASVKGTTDAILRWTAYGCWTAAIGAVFRTAARRRAGRIAYLAAGCFIAAGGWAGWFGWLNVPGFVFRSDEAALASTGARLAGFLQYANAYGAALGFFALLFWLTLAEPERRSRALSTASAFLLMPALGALLLTESRGAALALAAGFAVCAALRKRGERGFALSAAGLAVGFAAWAARAAFDAMRAGEPAAAVGTLLVATAVCGLLTLAVRPKAADALAAAASAGGASAAVAAAASGEPLGGERAAAVAAMAAGSAGHPGRAGRSDGLRAAQRRGARWRTTRQWLRRVRSRAAAWCAKTPVGLALLALGLAAAYGLLAGGASGGARVDGHLETAVARQTYYLDALRMFRDHPWLGTGGESWRMLVGLYQRAPYVGNEVHSGYLELLIDTGAIGFVLLLAMLVAYAVKTRKEAARVWGPAAVLLAHSAIDFDWSFGFLWLLPLGWIALHLPRPAAAGEAPRPRWRRAAAPLAAALLLAAAVAELPAAWRGHAAAREHEAALAAAASSPARATHLRAALEANPAWTRIRLELAPLLPQGEREGLLAGGLRYEPQSAPLALALGMLAAERGEAAPARDYLREGLRLARYDREAQNAAIARLSTLADRLAFAGREDEARVAAEGAVELYDNYRELYRQTYAGKANPWDDRSRGLFASAKFNAASALELLGRREEAKALFGEVAQEDAPDWQEQAEERLRQLAQGGE